MRNLPRALGRGGLILLWLSGGAVVLVAVFPWLRHSPRRRDAIRLSWFRGLGRILGLRLETCGRPASGPVLVVANHISWLDIVVLGCQAPMTFVAKAEVASWPLLGFLARHSGTLFIARRDLRNIRQVNQAVTKRLQNGERVVIFPEGTTTPGNQVLPFTSALLQAAIDARAPVQPVTLQYPGETATAAPFIGDDTFLASLWRILRLSRVEARCRWHPPLRGGRRRILADRARDLIAATFPERLAG
ncbi:1-acyl-sn-glycerol-3-phosphate acyltransferase [Methylomarinovum caldicuralii]|uniref:1-acyl-sn-glycerol-3-phosphate acyltransferase n=1 Tax=Methylomarinovum caldicuralii TaxID=438856 RepID=A0AAU9BQC2_9GAMM|nr:lysophospholipid acyltransferase family protein [Methylomarinovum caldicuralii]BCX80621.1 1-acyl-sn-glycerol-3-phosphate acyltransferase [Methylomarinovum caldicuralii]